MIHSILKDKPTKLFLGITAFFVANALIAECIGGKIFSLEKVFGFHPTHFSLFGQQDLSFSLTCGVLLWPLEFVITDVVNEYYGPKAVRRISYTAVVLIGYAFLMFYAAIQIAPANFWIASKQSDGIPDMQQAFGYVDHFWQPNSFPGKPDRRCNGISPDQKSYRQQMDLVKGNGLYDRFPTGG